jgi:hypothetical protein
VELLHFEVWPKGFVILAYEVRPHEFAILSYEVWPQEFAILAPWHFYVSTFFSQANAGIQVEASTYWRHARPSTQQPPQLHQL